MHKSETSQWLNPQIKIPFNNALIQQIVFYLIKKKYINDKLIKNL